MCPEQYPTLSDLERTVMQVVWNQGRVTAEEVRSALAEAAPMKDSTARTILRRLGEKGFVAHRIEGRTYVYTPRVERSEAASDAVLGIADKFCAGSIEQLLVGLVDQRVLSSARLSKLARKIEQAELEQQTPPKSRRGGKR